MPEENQTETAAPETAAPEAAAQEPDWKAEARKWEQRAKENKSKLDEAAPKLSEYDRLVQASKSDLERASEEATRWQSEAQKWRTSSVSSRIQALASNDFADPSDATAALNVDPDKYLGVDGSINDDAIRQDLAGVLEKKPHWRKTEPGSAGPRVPAPNQAQGSSNGKTAASPADEFAAIIQGQMRS